MITEQSFYNKEVIELKTIHNPNILDLDYYITFIQDDKEIKVNLYYLRKILRSANKNIKILKENGI